MKISLRVVMEASHGEVYYSWVQKTWEVRVNHFFDRIYKHLNFYWKQKQKEIESVD